MLKIIQGMILVRREFENLILFVLEIVDWIMPV